jgi:hypothetical protein
MVCISGVGPDNGVPKGGIKGVWFGEAIFGCYCPVIRTNRKMAVVSTTRKNYYESDEG